MSSSIEFVSLRQDHIYVYFLYIISYTKNITKSKKQRQGKMSFMSNKTPSYIRHSQIQPQVSVPNNSYSPYAQRSQYQMNSFSQMSPFSQEYAEQDNRNLNIRNQRQSCQTNRIAPPSLNSCNSYSNIQLNQIPQQNQSQQLLLQNNKIEQVEIQTLISPLILKAYNVLRQCELKPQQLDKIEASLKEKLNFLKKCHSNFKAKMNELLNAAEKKYEKFQRLIANQQKRQHAHSVDNLTKKVKRNNKLSEQMYDSKPSKSCPKTPKIAQNTARKNRRSINMRQQ